MGRSYFTSKGTQRLAWHTKRATSHLVLPRFSVLPFVALSFSGPFLTFNGVEFPLLTAPLTISYYCVSSPTNRNSNSKDDRKTSISVTGAENRDKCPDEKHQHQLHKCKPIERMLHKNEGPAAWTETFGAHRAKPAVWTTGSPRQGGPAGLAFWLSLAPFAFAVRAAHYSSRQFEHAHAAKSSLSLTYRRLTESRCRSNVIFGT